MLPIKEPTQGRFTVGYSLNDNGAPVFHEMDDFTCKAAGNPSEGIIEVDDFTKDSDYDLSYIVERRGWEANALPSEISGLDLRILAVGGKFPLRIVRKVILLPNANWFSLQTP